MIFPDVPTETWATKYRLRIADFTCPKCGGVFQTTQPVLMADCAGLQTPVHECGSGYTKVVLTPRTKEAKAFWNSLRGF